MVFELYLPRISTGSAEHSTWGPEGRERSRPTDTMRASLRRPLQWLLWDRDRWHQVSGSSCALEQLQDGQLLCQPFRRSGTGWWKCHESSSRCSWCLNFFNEIGSLRFDGWFDLFSTVIRIAQKAIKRLLPDWISSHTRNAFHDIINWLKFHQF